MEQNNTTSAGDQLQEQTTGVPQPVNEPVQPIKIGATEKMISTTGSSGQVLVDVQLGPLQDLKDTYSTIKKNVDVNLEQCPPLEAFNDTISILSARNLSAESERDSNEQTPLITQQSSTDTKNDDNVVPATAGASNEEEKKGGADGQQQQKMLNEQEKFIYQEMIPGVASRLVKLTKTSNSKYVSLVGDSIKGLVDLLIVELRLKTTTCLDLLDALRPIFNYSSPFYFHHHQKVLEAITSNSSNTTQNSTTTRFIQPKADLTDMTEEDIQWRQNLQEKDMVDVVKHDLGFSIESWSRGEIYMITGTADANLGDTNGDNVKKFHIKYSRDSSSGQKIFRADSLQVAPFDTKTQGDIEWRFNLQPGDEVDVLDSYSEWATCTIVKKENTLDSPLPMITVGFRRYGSEGDKEDSLGKYTGKGFAYDHMVPLYSCRVQKPLSVANGADPEGNVVWRYKVPTAKATTTTSSTAQDGPQDAQAASTQGNSGAQNSSPAPLATSNTSKGYSTNRLQDDKDMTMITSEDQRIYATERYTCKSSFLVNIINQFGEQGGFNSLLEMIRSPDVSLENLFYIVSMFTKNQSMYHKQFVDSFYDDFKDAVEFKLLSVTSDQLRQIKLERIDEIITAVWQTLLVRKIPYFELQVMKSQLTLKIGIMFMQQPFLAKRIDGAKMIDQVCKRAVSEIGNQSSQSMKAASPKNLLQELIDTLREANIVDLFFSNKNIHEQLVQRSDGLLKLMLKLHALSEQELDLIWANCQKHDSTALDFINALQSIAYSIDIKELAFFTTKILEKTPTTVLQKEVGLMLSMGRRTSTVDEGFQANQTRVIQFFWNYLFDEAADSYLDKGLATTALSALSELLRVTSVEVILAYFQQLIENIKTNKRGYFSVMVASKFVKLFVSKDDINRATLVDSFQRDHGLLDLLIGELSNYLKNVRVEVEKLSKQEEEANRVLAKDKLGNKVFFELFPHSTQLQDRMDSIKEFAKYGSFQITQQQIASIWTDVITLNPIVEDHKTVSAWLQTICDDFLLGRDTSMINYDDLSNFFHETICAETTDFKNINLEGYHCIQMFFLLVNLRAGKLVIQDDDVARATSGDDKPKWVTGGVSNRKLDPELIQVCAKVAPNEMVGIGILWRIAMDCEQRKVGECVTNMLLQVHTSVDFGLEEKITMFEDQFIASCLQIIERQRDAIESRSEEERKRLNAAYEQVYRGIATPVKLKRVLPVEEKRIVACLQYLKMLVLNSEKDGMNGLIPHKALEQGTFLDNITINNCYERMNNNGFRSRFTLPISSRSTIYQLKQQICLQMAWKQTTDGQWAAQPSPHPWTLRLTKFNGHIQIKDNDNGKTLADMGFGPSEVLAVYKKTTTSVSKFPLLTPENKLNERAKHVFTGIFDRYAIDDPDDVSESSQKVIMETQAYQYVRDATGIDSVAPGVASIMGYDSNQDGKMTLQDFLYFYEQSCTSRLNTVRSNLAKMGYRDDLQFMPPPGSPDNFLQERKTFLEMPRYKLSNNKESFASLNQLLNLQAEVSKEAQSFIRSICTNQEIYCNILKLGERTEKEGPFEWNMIFSKDTKVTMYSLDIIDSIIKTPPENIFGYESALRFNWVERFMNAGGFQHLLSELKSALALSKETLIAQDYLSESGNMCKKFVDQMLRLMKTFIFAAIYAGQETIDGNDFLVLKRHSSNVTDKKPKKEKVKPDMDEAQFQQASVTSTIGGPTVTYNGPYASVGTGTVVYGPQPPPPSSKAGDSDEANIGEEDQAEIERSMKEGEDKPTTGITQISTSGDQGTGKVANSSNNGQADSGLGEFEQTPRFQQIVAQIRQSKQSATLIQEINFIELQEKLLETLAIFLQNKSNQSKEEGNIISSALSLWSAAIVQKHELIDSFFTWTREAQDLSTEVVQILTAKDFLLHGIYSPKSVFVRTQFKECIELICEKVTKNLGETPLFFVIKAMMNHFPNPRSSVGTQKCGEYFSLFGALIKQYQEYMDSHLSDAVESALENNESISIRDLLRESFLRLRDHESLERDSESTPDSTLVGLLVLIKELLDCYVAQNDYDEVIQFTKKHQFLHEFYFENLYYMPERTTNTSNKCKSKNSRTNAYKLLYRLMVTFKPKEMAELLEDYLWPMIKELSRPTAWKHQPSQKERSAVHKYAGINNLGNICYMISMLQQFYMVPSFRYQLLKAVDESPEDIKTYKERKVDDSLLRQFQKLFGVLELSERAAADPFNFCFAYKDLTGEPTNVGVQCDSNEFLTFFFDRMEDVLRPTSQKYLFQDVFRGTFVSQMVCPSCGKVKNDLTPGYTLSVQVENTKDLAAGIQRLVQGEEIEDFKCSGCNQKVNIQKRQLLGEMPNVLIVHLQRIVFDFNTFGNKKVNSKLEFPSVLELGKYSFKEHMQGKEIVGEDDKSTAELARLMNAEDEDYVYRLVGVNIHRGVADSGHYWSMINTKRGIEEPDPVSNPQGWRASNESDWKKFDDDQVSSYNFNDIGKDSFGGDASSLTSDEQYIANTAGGNWGRSAYMLIYEKKLKKPIREVVLSSNSDDEEKIISVDYRSVEASVPEWLRSMVQKDNTEFVIDRQVFNTQFFYLVKLVLKHISADLSMTQHQYPLDYIPHFNRMHTVALKIGQKVMFDFLSHYHENACLSHITDYMQTIFTFSDSWVSFVRKAEEPSIICDWIQATLLDDQCTYFFHLMFNCPDTTARLYCGKIIASVINKGFRILSVCEEKEADREHQKVKKLRAAIDNFMSLALGVIHTRDCQKNWTRLEQFYKMLEDICTGGKPQAEYLIARENCSIVIEICDLLLQKRSPKAKDEAEPRVEMSGAAARAQFGPLVNILCTVVCCMHTQTIQVEAAKTFKEFTDPLDSTKAPQRVSQKNFLTDEQLEFITNTDLINLIMSCEYEIDSFADALAHICFGNKKLSKDICQIALKAIIVSDYNRISQYLQVVKNQLQIDDYDLKSGISLLRRRLEWIFGFPYFNTGLEEGEVHKIGLDSLNNSIRGEVYTYKSMLTHDPDSNQSLLHLLWRYQGRMENYTMSCLNYLADMITHSETHMEFFSKLPGVTYQYARYSDWIQPFLMSQLNKSDAASAYSTYPSTSKEDIVKVMSKLEIYESYVHKNDKPVNGVEDTVMAEPAQAQQPDQEEAKENQERIEIKQEQEAIQLGDQESAPKLVKSADSMVLKSDPPAYIICQCKDENYLNVVEHDGVMLSMSYLKGTYVMSRPTGYTNLAVSPAFLASGSNASKADKCNMLVAPQQSNSNKSASAMLAELEQQKAGGAQSYAEHGTVPLRVKKRPNIVIPKPEDSADANGSVPPKIYVDGDEQWASMNDDGYRQDVEDGNARDPQSASTEGYQYQDQDPQNSNLPADVTAPQDREMQQIETSGAKNNEIIEESFENWTGDEMHTCDDLVYKLTLTNTTEQPILFKVDFKDSGEGANLSWPVNGIKGKLAAGERATVAILPKILPGQAPTGEKFELEKLRVNVTSKPDVEKIAQQEASNDVPSIENVPAIQTQQSGATQPQGAHSAHSYPEDDFYDMSEKNCNACTMLNPINSTVCSICGTPF